VCTVLKDHLQPNYVSLFTFFLHKWIQGLNRKEFEEEKTRPTPPAEKILSSFVFSPGGYLPRSKHYIFLSVAETIAVVFETTWGNWPLLNLLKGRDERERKKPRSLDLSPPPPDSITLVSSCCFANQATRSESEGAR